MNYNNPNLRILNIYHADMDGVTSHIVLKNFYKTVIGIPVTYNTEWTLKNEILTNYKDKFDCIICTDFYPEQTIGFLKEQAVTLVLDHHESVEQYNNDIDVIINTAYSGTKLTYNFISKFKDIKYLNDLVTIVNDWDMFILKDKRSTYFNNMFWEMGMKWFMRRFIKGNITLYPEEKQYFIDAQKEFKDMYESLVISDLARNGVYFETSRFHHECMEELKKEGYKWFLVRNKNNLSIRCDDIDLTFVCKKIGKGGGHPHAVGIPIAKTDNVPELIQKIEQEVDFYYMNMTD